MNKQEWMLWDRIFLQAMWETDRSRGSSALAVFRKSMETTMGISPTPSEIPANAVPISEIVPMSIEDRLRTAGQMADAAIAERRKR
jgi:hypothetical protein